MISDILSLYSGDNKSSKLIMRRGNVSPGILIGIHSVGKNFSSKISTLYECMRCVPFHVFRKDCVVTF